MTCHPNRNRGVAPSRRAAQKRDRRRWRRLATLSGPEIVLAALPSYPRPVLERMASRIIDRLDAIDGDADSEPYGDELDSSGSEEEDYIFHGYCGPGCPISDPDLSDHENTSFRPIFPLECSPLRLVPPT